MQNYNENPQTTTQEYRDIINEQKMCLESFILRVKDEMSISCSIPVKIPDKNLLHIIEQCKKWFYEHYEYSVEEAYLFINRNAFRTDEFKKASSLILLPDVFSVYGVYKVGGHLSTMWDYIKTSNTSYVNSYNNMSEDLMGYVIQEHYLSFRNQMLANKYVKWSYNELTHNFRVGGEIPTEDVVLEVYRTIPDCALFNNGKFFDYVVAKCHKNIAKVLGLFTYNLPGGVTINYDMIQQMGQEAIDKIEEEIKTSEGVNWFFVS